MIRPVLFFIYSATSVKTRRVLSEKQAPMQRSGMCSRSKLHGGLRILNYLVEDLG